MAAVLVLSHGRSSSDFWLGMKNGWVLLAVLLIVDLHKNAVFISCVTLVLTCKPQLLVVDFVMSIGVLWVISKYTMQKWLFKFTFAILEI